MKKICLFIMLSLCFATVYAGFDLNTAISYIGKSNLPFDFTKEGGLYDSYHLNNPNNVIPDKIYENFQLTEYFNARDNIDTGLDLCFTCKLGSDLYLCLIRVGGIIEPATYVLTSVNSNYKVVQSLEVGVTLAGSYLKQFRITDNRQVYVYRLVPTSNASVSFRTFKSDIAREASFQHSHILSRRARKDDTGLVGTALTNARTHEPFVPTFSIHNTPRL